MKHVFVVNPAAGKGRAAQVIVPKIEDYFSKNNLDYLIHLTSAPGEGIEFVKKTAAESNEPMRFYACGGDGTLFEIVNGAYGFPHVEVAIIPLGSGNDFIRLFGSKELFMDMDGLVNGVVRTLDLIRCGDLIAINQCSMGFDAEVNANQATFKKLPLLNGESAYVVSMLYCFFKKLNNVFTITIDDGEPFTQNTLFCVAGNSRWYGGGFKAAPLALPDDGLLDFIIVKKSMGRLKLLTLVNKYKQGLHLDWEMTRFVRGKKIRIQSDTPAAINCDGEKLMSREFVFEIIEKGIKLVIPKNSPYLKKAKEEE